MKTILGLLYILSGDPQHPSISVERMPLLACHAEAFAFNSNYRRTQLWVGFTEQPFPPTRELWPRAVCVDPRVPG